jgi:phage terminase small subunit
MSMASGGTSGIGGKGGYSPSIPVRIASLEAEVARLKLAQGIKDAEREARLRVLEHHFVTVQQDARKWLSARAGRAWRRLWHWLTT